MSHIRTIAAGIAVFALCVLLLSSSWLFVLLIFVVAGLGWAAWSLLREWAGKDRGPILHPRRNRERAGSKRRKALKRGNVYPFQSRVTAMMSEAADS